MDSLRAGDLVFIPCSDSGFAAACVSSIGDDGTVVVDLNSAANAPKGTRRVARADVRTRFARDDGSTSQDNTSLVHLNDATILENLCARHEQDEIYTYTASVLLAVNPYKEIDGLYSDEQCARYRGKHIGALPPHPYAIADTAYRALARERRNQGLLISGESGAGKTETAKIVMQYLSYVSGTASDLAAHIQARVLRAQPILESFGNAVTMRNSNSSRFGKYNRVFFNEAGTLVDAGITTYLLESSRVVVHGERERTYHCFYEMLMGLSDSRLQELQLVRYGSYRLMCSGEPVMGFEKRDASNFRRLCDALQTVGLDEEAIDSMMEVLAGLVHLGDIPKDEDLSPVVDRDEDETKTVDVNEERVDAAARLLGMDPDALGATLKRKKVAVPGRSSFHEVPRTASQLRQALHSLIKALYKRLFERTVQRINDSFGELRPEGARGGDQSAWRHIGILDIYGFERLQRNSFEQLCINLANERLQQYFVENVLVAEQSVYKREGLCWTGLALPDSQPVVNCIAQVFRTLDEYSQQLAKGFETASDEKFCQKTLDEATKCPIRKEVLKQLKISGKKRSSLGPAANEGFIIRHFAGGVEYCTKGWLDKNNDRLLTECEALICESTSPLVRSLAEEDQGKAPFRSISKKYAADLEGLLKMLGSCDLHYIRCFKPNEEQKAKIFNKRLVFDQIVQCGTIELVRIMHDGYPNRCPFEEITSRFKDLLPESFQRYGMRTFIEALMLAYEVPREEWALGMSRLFLKAGQLRALEDMRSDGARPKAEHLAHIVSSIVRRRWVRAGLAVQLCNFIPRFIAQIRERRRLARRRLLSHLLAVRFAQSVWGRIRQRRADQLARALRLAVLLHVRLRRGLAAACRRARDAVERRHEEERQRELDRLREEELRRQRKEEERLRQLDRQREEQQRQLEEEQRQRQLQSQREAKQRQLVEEQRQRHLEEERRRESERQREEQKQRQLEDKLRLESDCAHGVQRRLSVDGYAEHKEKERRLSILAQASPQHAKPQPPVELTAASLSPVATSLAHSVCPSAEEIAYQMDERIRALEQEMARKQEEVMQQMRFLQQKNELLERSLESEREQKEAACAALSAGGLLERGGEAEPAASPEARRKVSLIPLDEQEPRRKVSLIPLDEHEPRRKVSLIPLDEHTPCPSTPLHSSSVKKSCNSRSARSYSLISPIDVGSSSRRRLSTASLAAGGHRRPSAAHEALSAARLDGGGCSQHRLGDAPGGSGDIRSQRRWWAEQRQFLLEDLYPQQVAAGSARRGGPGSSSTQPVRLAATDACAGQPGSEAPAAAAAACGREVRNLSATFAHIEDVPLPPPSETAPSCSDAAAAQHPEKQDSKLKQPQFFWSKRMSVAG